MKAGISATLLLGVVACWSIPGAEATLDRILRNGITAEDLAVSLPTLPPGTLQSRDDVLRSTAHTAALHFALCL